MESMSSLTTLRWFTGVTAEREATDVDTVVVLAVERNPTTLNRRGRCTRLVWRSPTVKEGMRCPLDPGQHGRCCTSVDGNTCDTEIQRHDDPELPENNSGGTMIRRVDDRITVDEDVRGVPR